MNSEPQQSAGSATDPDRPLVSAARAGDYAAFEQLVARYERPLYTLALRITQRVEDAEEVVQETFLSVVQHLKDFQEASRFYTWLVRIATNHALKLLRRRRTRRAVSLDAHGGGTDAHVPQDLPRPEFIAPWAQDPARLAHAQEVRELLDTALAELAEKYRVVFLLRDVEGLSVDQTARLLGITQSNVKVRLMRARLQLRERLTRQFGDERQRVAPHAHEDDLGDAKLRPAKKL